MRGQLPRRSDKNGRRFVPLSYACEGCERCINLCPKQAIQTSVLRAALVLALMSGCLVPCPALLIEAIGPSMPAWALRVLWPIAAAVLGFLALRLVDMGLIQAGRLPPLRPILGFGWTRWTRRFRALARP